MEETLSRVYPAFVHFYHFFLVTANECDYDCRTGQTTYYILVSTAADRCHLRSVGAMK